MRAWLVLVALAILGIAAPAHASGLAFAIERHETPATLCPDETRWVELDVRNVGLVPWSPGSRDRIAYHWRDESGAIVEHEGLRTELPRIVLPGMRVRVRARVHAPAHRGAYVLEWAMVREDVQWQGEPAGARTTVEIAGEGPALAWSIVDAGTLPTLVAGESADVVVQLRNDGCARASAAAGDALAHRWIDGDGRVIGEGARTPMPELEPGAVVEVHASVRAPAHPGELVLAWEPVREQVAWWGAPREGDPSLAVAIEPSALAWSIVELAPVSGGRAGEEIEVRVRVRNEGTQAWTSERGDAWSYRWVDAHDRPLPIEGVRTPWPHDVAPGDEIAVHAKLVLPDEGGRWRLAWQPVREHVRWYGPPQDELDWIAEVEVEAIRLDWAIERAEVPARMWAGRTTTVRVVARNTGDTPWSPATGDRFSYRIRDANGDLVPGDGMRTELPHDVAVGESIALDVRVRPPADVGAVELELAMVREHVAWFPAPGGPARHRVRLAWAGATASVLALVGALALALVVRRGRAPSPLLVLAWIPMWTAVVVALVGEVFRDLSGIEPWADGGLAAVSSAAWAGVAVALVPARARAITAAIVAALALALALVDLGYLEFFGAIVPMSAMAAVHHLGDAHATVASLWRPRYALFVVPALAFVVALALRPHAPEPRPSLRAAFVLLLVLAGVPSARAVYELATGPVGARVFSERDNVGRIGLWNAHAFEVSRAIRARVGANELAPELRAEIAAFFAERSAAARPDALAPGANLVIVQVEALQAWVVDARVGGEAVMPFLAGADDRAVRFTSIWDQTAQGRTSDAEYLVVQSGHPLASGALAFLRADNHFDTIAHRLADAGYTTTSAHPYARGFWNRAVLHPRYGFASSRFREEIGAGPQVGWGLSDREFLARMVDTLATTPQPFFAFLVTLGLHHPYEEFPASLAELELGELEGTALGNYLQAMRHVDGALANTIARLEEKGLLANTVVVVYGDHAAGLPLSRELLALAGERGDDPTLATRMHRVAAFVWIPGAPIAGRDDRPGGAIDLGPTALQILGVAPSASFVGRSLLSDGPRVVVLPDGSAIDDARLWLARGRGGAAGDACVERTSGRGRPPVECEALAAAAQRELEVSRAVLDHDLHRSIPSP